MQPSNTSRSDAILSGVLQPLVDSLSRPRKAGDLSGQVVVIAREDIKVFIALDSAGDIHLLMTPAAGESGRAARIDLRGMKVIDADWVVADQPVARYLDISCTTGAFPSFKRPFLRFAEDILFEVGKAGTLPIDAAYRTFSRWKKFWSAEPPTQFTSQWLHGIIGELSFLKEMIGRADVGVVRSWTGPQGKDHDFQHATEIAIEVKTSTEVPFVIRCNLRQLDPTLFTNLYLACYKIDSSDAGISLPDLIRELEVKFETDSTLLDIFYERLRDVGYRRDLDDKYSESRFILSPAAIFRVDESFPKLTHRSFIETPDNRISDIRYTLKLSGIESTSLDHLPTELLKSMAK